MTTNWHAISTKHKAELKVAVGLGAEGIGVFYPVRRLRSIWRGVRGTRIASLMPGYLFADFDSSRDIPLVNGHDGVQNILRADGGTGKPSIVPRVLIEALREAVDDGVFNSTPWGWLAPGDKVRIKDGPYAGIIATMAKARSSRQIEIFMNGSNKTTISIDNLEKVSA